MITSSVGGLQQTTSYKVVLPFYAYAAISFFVGAFLLFLNTDVVAGNHINPHALAITHVMALAWGTMIIFGASYQLLPVLIEGKLDSNLLAYLTFIFAAIGIPILVYGFYIFDYIYLLPIGGTLVNIGVLCYVINVFISSFKSEKRNIHAWYIITASLWLFSTTFFGLLLVFNFNSQFFLKDSWSYLSIHAHLGLIGWFLLLVIGVGSRLIPMFLISKYEDNKSLWIIFFLINFSLISFIFLRTFNFDTTLYYLPILSIFIGVSLFLRYVLKARKVRIRKKVDRQVKTSIFSVVQMIFPILVLIIILLFLPVSSKSNMPLIYGFTMFFGWITGMILGMTYKTLPFIVWNKVYDKEARRGKTLTPKDLFSEPLYYVTIIFYLSGFFIFIIGAVMMLNLLIKIGAGSITIAAAVYFYNTSKAILHKAK